MRWPFHPSFTAESMEWDCMLLWGPDETCCRLKDLLPIKNIGLCPAPTPLLRCAQCLLMLGLHRDCIRQIGTLNAHLIISTTREGDRGGSGIEAQLQPQGAVKPYFWLGC